MDPGGGGGRGSGLPLNNHKAIGFLSKTGPDPLENHKATKLVFNVGPSIENSVSNDFFLSTFFNSINVFDCCLSGVIQSH